MAPPDRVRCWVDDMFEQAPSVTARIAVATIFLERRAEKRVAGCWIGDPDMALSCLVLAAKRTAAGAISARNAASHRREAINM
jgi:hypothetical protein